LLFKKTNYIQIYKNNSMQQLYSMQNKLSIRTSKLKSMEIYLRDITILMILLLARNSFPVRSL
jgi:hypothetical protein